MPPPLGDLAGRDPTTSPDPTNTVPAAALVLRELDGRRTLDELTHQVMEGFPGLFTARPVALRFVTELAERYGMFGPAKPVTNA